MSEWVSLWEYWPASVVGRLTRCWRVLPISFLLSPACSLSSWWLESGDIAQGGIGPCTPDSSHQDDKEQAGESKNDIGKTRQHLVSHPTTEAGQYSHSDTHSDIYHLYQQGDSYRYQDALHQARKNITTKLICSQPVLQ